MIKKLFLILLISVLLLPVAGLSYTHKAYAETDSYGYDWMANAPFEIDWVDDNGKFVYRGEANSLSEAEGIMRQLAANEGNDDFCVRYKANPSPMHVVSMISGFAYSYPGRNGANTMSIYQKLNGNQLTGKRTYVERHYEMDYVDTERLLTSGNYNGMGMVRVSLNGFVGYCDLECVDLVPRKMVERGSAFWLGGNNSYENEAAYRMIMPQNYYDVGVNNGYRSVYFHYARAYASSGSLNPTDSYTLCLGPAPEFMADNTRYYSNDGVHFYTDGRYKNYAGTYYNYYQFLSFRTKTRLTADNLNSFITHKGYNSASQSLLYNSGQIFIDSQNTYGMNALLIFCLGIHESGYGRSAIARAKNNLFGINAVDASPGQSANTFASIADCVNDLCGYYLEKYADYDHEYYASAVFGNKSVGANMMYASDPYWGMCIASLAYEIDRYVSGGNGNLTDYNAYKLAEVKTFNANFLYAPNGAVAFGSTYNYDYQLNHAVTVLDFDETFTKIQSPNPIENGVVVKTQPKTRLPYNYDSSVLYVSNNDVTPINYTYPTVEEPPVVEPEPEYGEFIHEDMNLVWSDEGLTLSGKAYREGLEEEGLVKLTLGENVYKIYREINEGIINFEDTLDADDLGLLENGQYLMNITVEYPEHPDLGGNFNISVTSLPGRKVINNKIYTFSFDSNNDVLLKVADENNDYEALATVSELTMTEGKLSISGKGLIRGLDSNVPGETKHYVVFYNFETLNEDYVAECTDTTSFYSLNDGFEYTEVGYELTDYDISGIDLGSYGLKMRVVNGDVTETCYLKTSKASLSEMNMLVDDKVYHLVTNDAYLYRFELDVEKVSPSIDYTTVSKPDQRRSFSSFTAITIDEETKTLSMNLASMIYYLNYSNENNPLYNVYLVNDDGVTYPMNVVHIENKYDYKTNYNSSYNLDNISVNASIDLNTITEPGTYRIIIEINNNEDGNVYKDYVELKNPYGRTLPSVEGYVLDTVTAKDRIVLRVN